MNWHKPNPLFCMQNTEMVESVFKSRFRWCRRCTFDWCTTCTTENRILKVIDDFGVLFAKQRLSFFPPTKPEMSNERRDDDDGELLSEDVDDADDLEADEADDLLGEEVGRRENPLHGGACRRS